MGPNKDVATPVQPLYTMGREHNKANNVFMLRRSVPQLVTTDRTFETVFTAWDGKGTFSPFLAGKRS